MEKKKLAAAIAAVYACIRTSEEAMAQGVPQIIEPDTGQTGVTQLGGPSYNTWGITGRQNQMQANSMMQMRMFK